MGLDLIEYKDLKKLNELGAGGFGTVYRAEWTKNGTKRIVAMKQIKDVLTKGAGPVSNVLKEVGYQYLLRHPNIVPLFGVSLGLGKDIIIVMGFVDGIDLHTLLFPKSGNVPALRTRHKVSLALDMCSAIAYIHAQGILHRDIKPHNMMVSRHTPKLYVCDFGISKYLGKMDMMEFATQHTNSVAGTLFYMAPECLQADATGKYLKPTLAADIWSLGIVFYELFTLKHLCDNVLLFNIFKLRNDNSFIKKQVANVQEPFQSDYCFEMPPVHQHLSSLSSETLAHF